MFEVAFYDTEVGTDPKKVGWKNHKAMEFACGCIHSVTYVKDGENWIPEQEKSHCHLLAEEFALALNRHDLVVGFNNIGFDDLLITAHAGKNQEFLFKRFDMFDDLVARTGIKYVTSLERLVRTTIGEGKTEGVSGENIPQMWQEGKTDEVIEYCRRDCEVLFLLFEFARKYDYVLLEPNKNPDLFGNMVLKIPVDWKQKFPTKAV
jgi:hypothetical protein